MNSNTSPTEAGPLNILKSFGNATDFHSNESEPLNNSENAGSPGGSTEPPAAAREVPLTGSPSGSGSGSGSGGELGRESREIRRRGLRVPAQLSRTDSPVIPGFTRLKSGPGRAGPGQDRRPLEAMQLLSGRQS